MAAAPSSAAAAGSPRAQATRSVPQDHLLLQLPPPLANYASSTEESVNKCGSTTHSAPTLLQLPNRHDTLPVDGYLNFTDIPDDILQVPFTEESNTTIHREAFSSRLKDGFTPVTSLQSIGQTAASTVGQSTSHPKPIRKTSPGLSARLKALGFGSFKSTSSLSNPSAAYVEQNPQSWQLNTVKPKSTLIKRSRSSNGLRAIPQSESLSPGFEGIVARSVESLQLPPLEPTGPLIMDTQKYRLPDHSNSNGTKVTLETRREHIERSTLPASPNQIPSPAAPPPPPKDTPPAVASPSGDTTANGGQYVPGLSSYFTAAHNRPGSIYTLSRASFANQLAQLTSLQLPDAQSLSSKVSAIPTAQAASKALINAAEQIKSWVSKASEVIGGLNSDDDVEWAAAGGREGLVEVENALGRFEDLINVYVTAIDRLQARKDIGNVPPEDLHRAVGQMEAILEEWTRIRKALESVRNQVEIAMEWEELWNNVLGDIQSEMDELSRLVFEMEERRHKGIVAQGSGDGVDEGDLESIVEGTPPPAARLQAQTRLSLPPLPGTPNSPGIPSLSQDDSSLLALFARMQPLRASLDFLPMRLSAFENRASGSFPTACEELEMRRAGLDGTYKKLEKDAEVLRKELGEDRWVVVFRGAGRQAQKMHESVERSLFKLREALEDDKHSSNQPAVNKKMESYEAKKTHYGPAIERVLSIIDRGVKDRLTVNGEVLRLHSDLQRRWHTLKGQIQEMDKTVDDILSDRKGRQLRDSISSMLSNDRSTIASGHETPTSSPPSSVIMSTLGFDPHTPVSKLAKNQSPSAGHAAQRGNPTRRLSSLPTPSIQLAKRTGASRLSTIPSSSSTTPVPASRMQRPGSAMAKRPAWNSSVNTNNVDTGHNFKPLSLTTPSPYARKPSGGLSAQRPASSLATTSTASKLPFRTSMGRATSESPQVEETPTRRSNSRLSFRDRISASPGRPGQGSLTGLKTRLAPHPSDPAQSSSSNRRASFQPSASASTIDEGSQPSRPASSLASSTPHRNTLLPQPRRLTKANPKASQVKDTRPRWR